MKYQVYGQAGTPGEKVQITAKNVAGNLELWATGPDDGLDPARSYNGLYYRAPAANIKSLTIRGSDDDETIRIEGPLRLAGPGDITLVGRGGNDTFELVNVDGDLTQNFVPKVTIDGRGDGSPLAAGETNRVLIDNSASTHVNRFTFAEGKSPDWMTVYRGYGLPSFEFTNLTKYTLQTGSGYDEVQVQAVPSAASEGTYVYTGDGIDTIVVGSPTTGLAKVNSTVYVDGQGDSDYLTVDDSGAAAADNRYTLGTSDDPGYTHRLSRGVYDSKTGQTTPLLSIYSTGVSEYDLKTGPGADLIRVDKAGPDIDLGVYIYSGGAIDQVVVGQEMYLDGTGKLVGDGLSQVQTIVYVDGQADYGEVVIEDRADTAPNTFRQYPDPLGNGWDMWVAADNSSSLVIAKNADKYTIQAGKAADTVYVQGTSALAQRGNFVYGNDGDDTVTVGSWDKGLDNVKTDVTVTGGAGADTLVVDDEAGTPGQTYRVDTSKISRDGGPSVVSGDTLFRTVRTTVGDDTVNLLGNPAGVGLQVDAGPGTDTLAVVSGDFLDPVLSGFEVLNISGGRLQLDTTSLALDRVLQTGGELAGAADVTAAQSVEWSGGTMSGTGRTVALSTSTLTLSNLLTLSGRTLENQGTGNWDGATIGGGTGTVRNTGYLSGTGTLSGTLVNDGALLPAGAGAVGTITVEGAFSSAGTYAVDLGADSDRVVAQSVTLGGALSPTSIAGFPADRYTIVDNTGPDPVVGIFDGYPEGAIVEVAGVRYRITYQDDVEGDGADNDVVLERVGRIGNWVWYDEDEDGLQPQNLPLAGVPVRLYSTTSGLVGSTTSGLDGSYWFDDVPAGGYYVEFDLPGPHYHFTYKDVGPDDTIDSDVGPLSPRTATFTLAPGEVNDTIDAGIALYGAVGDWVWNDYYIGGDGIQNDNLGGWGGLTVTLTGGFLEQPLTTTTDPSGYYQFDDLQRKSNWAWLQYQIQFTKPADYYGQSGGYNVYHKYAFAPAHAGGDPTRDSDADPTTGLADWFNLYSSDGSRVRTDIDCGIEQFQGSSPGYMGMMAFDGGGGEGMPDALAGDAVPGVSGRAWADDNGDGVQDPWELPVPGWKVGLYTSAGALVGETWTAVDGTYSFPDVAAGQYQVKFAAPTGGPRFTLMDQGGDDTVDSDVDAGGVSAVIVVGLGGVATAVDAGLIPAGPPQAGGRSQLAAAVTPANGPGEARLRTPPPDPGGVSAVGVAPDFALAAPADGPSSAPAPVTIRNRTVDEAGGQNQAISLADESPPPLPIPTGPGVSTGPFLPRLLAERGDDPALDVSGVYVG